MPGRYPTDDDDDEDEDEEDEYKSSEGEDDGWDDDKVDTDVLPTMLVYRGGELVHSWVRVDWEAKTGVEELLKRCALSFLAIEDLWLIRCVACPFIDITSSPRRVLQADDTMTTI